MVDFFENNKGEYISENRNNFITIFDNNMIVNLEMESPFSINLSFNNYLNDKLLVFENAPLNYYVFIGNGDSFLFGYLLSGAFVNRNKGSEILFTKTNRNKYEN